MDTEKKVEIFVIEGLKSLVSILGFVCIAWLSALWSPFLYFSFLFDGGWLMILSPILCLILFIFAFINNFKVKIKYIKSNSKPDANTTSKKFLNIVFNVFVVLGIIFSIMLAGLLFSGQGII